MTRSPACKFYFQRTVTNFIGSYCLRGAKGPNIPEDVALHARGRGGVAIKLDQFAHIQERLRGDAHQVAFARH